MDGGGGGSEGTCQGVDAKKIWQVHEVVDGHKSILYNFVKRPEPGAKGAAE